VMTHQGVPDVAGRVTLLRTALKVGRDRLDEDAVRRAEAAVERTGQRLRLGAEHTVVALVGSTGSGKSSLFNALAGIEISEVGVCRPTTSSPTACVWGLGDPSNLLDWLQVPDRHRVSRETVLDADRQAGLHGLVLLDLPDFDSSASGHREEVDRLIGLVDLLVWVVDPQKYADQALHKGYLKHLTSHDGVMVVVLNQIDLLSPEEALTCHTDLRRLLVADGLKEVRLLATSARRGDGVDDLRAVLAEIVAEHTATANRAAGDLDTAARELSEGVARHEPSPRTVPGSEQLLTAMAEAAGIPGVLDAVTGDYRRRARRWVDFSYERWLRRILPDRTGRLHLGEVGVEMDKAGREAPEVSPAQRERVELAVRNLTESVAQGLPDAWAREVRETSRTPGDNLPHALDAAVREVDLTPPRKLWWPTVGLIQDFFTVLGTLGLLWTCALLVAGMLGQDPRPPSVGSVPLPSALLTAGFVVAGALAAAGRWATVVGARRLRERLAAELREAVATVAWTDVVSPLSDTLTEHRTVRELLEAIIVGDPLPVGLTERVPVPNPKQFLGALVRADADIREAGSGADPGGRAEPGQPRTTADLTQALPKASSGKAEPGKGFFGSA
jgi:energy-coupling factor transporter ATP-binding protein EcfA2